MIKLFTLLIQLSLLVLQYLERQRITGEVETKLVKELLLHANKMVEKAHEAASSVPSNPDDVLLDAANRDNWTGGNPSAEKRSREGSV